MDQQIQGFAVERRCGSEQVAGYYKSLIDIGRIKPGDKLPGRSDIAYIHNVGEMVAQRALALLKSWGYARTVPRRGSWALLPDAGPPAPC